MDPKTQTIAISKETVGEMPVVEYPGGTSTITVVDTLSMARMALRELTRARVVGFDTETRPSFTRGRVHKVALMQLSTDEHCYLFRLNKIGIPAALRSFLENPEIIKIGLSVHDDFSVMRRISSDLDPQGFIDLQEYVKYFHINDISLQKIYAIVFQEKISKNQRLTNWEAPTLTDQQQIYAALDAWACLRLYRTLRSGAYNPDESPFIVDRSELCPSSNNQLLGPIEAAKHAEKMRLAFERQEQQRAEAAKLKEQKSAEKNGDAASDAKKAKKEKAAKKSKKARSSKKTTDAAVPAVKAAKPRKKRAAKASASPEPAPAEQPKKKTKKRTKKTEKPTSV